VSNKVEDEPLKSVIQNCRRLIADAELLLEKGGSAGSACSLAIMAFEEAGKGHSHELEFKRNRKQKIHSQHHFRHLMSAMVMMASLHQKYDLKNPSYTEQQIEEIRKRFGAAKTFSEFASSPVVSPHRSGPP
jgi:AbiV family abortive infection protein